MFRFRFNICLKWPVSLKIRYGQYLHDLLLSKWSMSLLYKANGEVRPFKSSLYTKPKCRLYEGSQLNRSDHCAVLMSKMLTVTTVIVALRPCFLHREKERERGIEQGRQVERMTQCRMWASEVHPDLPQDSRVGRRRSSTIGYIHCRMVVGNVLDDFRMLFSRRKCQGGWWQNFRNVGFLARSL